MKKILSITTMISGFLIFISLYIVAIIAQEETADYIIVIGCYISVLMFTSGITYTTKFFSKPLKYQDGEVYQALKNEQTRQKDHLELIASENYVSENVLKVTGSILTNKYAEGYPGKRYYGGCQNVDVIETLAIERVKKIFSSNFANVQPHSGSQANQAAYRALLNPGDTVLGMSLDHGGHLTHGHHLSFSGQDYVFHSYFVNDEGFIDYEDVRIIANKIKPKLIVAGASAYPRHIDFKEFRKIADEVNAYLMVDMAHIAGLVAAGLHQNPVPYADVVTSTTHKTLRGPRGGIILCNDEKIAKKINQVVFPGIQGGPLMHIIAGKAVAFEEVLQPSFIKYQEQVLKNAKTLADELRIRGYHIISNGTDNHLLLIDVKSSVGITGKEAEVILDSVNITCNKNTIPNDTEKPAYASGIRLGTPALTTRGMKEKEMVEIAALIDEALRNRNHPELLKSIKTQALKIARRFPVFFNK